MAKPGSSYHDPNHHRSSTQSNKPFKGRHGHKSKSALKAITKGKVEKTKGDKVKAHVPSKIDRRNTQKQILKNKKEEQVRNAKFFGGARGAAKIVTVVSLCPDVDVHKTIGELNSSVGAETHFEGNLTTLGIEQFKQTLQYITPATSSTTDVLDACLPADFILLLLSSTVEVSPSSLNTLRSILSQGTPTIIPIVANLMDHTHPKTRVEIKKSLLSYIQQYIPTTERVFAADERGDAAVVMRLVCTGIPHGIRWREQRSYILPEGWRWDEEEGKVVFWGTVRGKSLQVDRLLDLGTWGEFQIDKICSLPEVNTKSKGSMDIDGDMSSMDVNPTSTILATPSPNQDPLSPLADVEITMDDDTKSILSHRSQSQKGVRIDDHYYFPDDDPKPVKRKHGKDTNDYQEAWHISDSEDSNDAHDPNDEIEMGYPSDSDELIASDNEEEHQSEAGETASEMHLDLSPEEEARQLELFKARESDAHFPDEVEYSPLIPARTRFARYRALKNFRSSPWDIDEPEDDRCPSEWSRLLRITNWRGTCSKITSQSSQNGLDPGIRVQIYLRSCPPEILSRPPRAVYSLLTHENKITTLNFSITPVPREDEEAPVIKSKDVLVVQYASRRYEFRPIFSQPVSGGSENNVRKFERYLQLGRTSIASWIGKTVIGKEVPVLFFKKTSEGLELVATGSSMAPSPPIIVKRAVLTGHPYRVHKKVVTMRYMFFNREDVLFYKPVQLVSKQGRRGWIKEALGTHGYFKANFDGKIDKQDTVGLSLYKRVWPRLGV